MKKKLCFCFASPKHPPCLPTSSPSDHGDMKPVPATGPLHLLSLEFLHPRSLHMNSVLYIRSSQKGHLL